MNVMGLISPSACMIVLLLLTYGVSEAIEVESTGILIYTDDVGLFSATRRLSRDGDPTQPAIDTRLTNKGSDVIFEPQLNLTHSLTSGYGTTTVGIYGQGFIFTDHSRFNQASLRIQGLHEFTPETRVRLRYYYAPNQFLGDNEEHRSGTRRMASEDLTSHIWSARLERTVTPDFEVRLLARFGLRRYNENFSQRNTDFWTVGPHIEWRILPKVKLGLGYHYERGLAEGRKQSEIADDVSYVNHYGSLDIDIELTERWTLMTAFHYERNNWTSGLEGDERRGAHENVYQGEVIVVRRLTEAARIFAGVQRSNRKQSFEDEQVKNTNFGVGLTMVF